MHSDLHSPKPGAKHRHGGTSQNTRLLAVLQPAAVPVDGRTEEELLAWAAGLSEAVVFFDRQNRPDGDWGPFFEAEPIVQYARISLQDMGHRAAALRQQLHAWQVPVVPENAVLAEGNLLTLLYEQCQRINRWHGFFSRRREEHVFAAEVESAIELTLCGALETARCWEAGVAAAGPDILERFRLEHDLAGFDAVLWRTDAEAAGGMEEMAVRQQVVPRLLWAAYTAEARLVAAGRARLHVLLAAPTRLAPHFALYLAFLRQMRLHAQKQLNELTGQHLDLFYRTLLEEKPAPPVPDRAYVALGLAAGAAPFQLPAGTRLMAKDAAGQPLLYALQEPLEMAGHSIGQLQTVITYPATPGAADDLRVLATEVEAVAAEPWPMFGAVPAANAPGAGTAGFALASPCLLLAGGERRVCVRMCFQLGGKDAPALLKTGGSDPQEEPGVYAVYSGAAGWVAPAAAAKRRSLDLALKHGAAAGQIVAEVVVRLGPEDPPCVLFDPQVLQGQFDPGSAVLKILRRDDAVLTSRGSVHGAFLWLLSGACVTGMTLEVGVCHAPVHGLANDLGVIAPGVPILPFGFAPGLRAVLYLTYAEILAKSLQKLTLHLQWQNLPPDPQLYRRGLVDYYSDYAASLLRLRPDLGPRLFSREEYRVAVESKAGDSWLPLAATTLDAKTADGLLPLFQPALAANASAQDPALRHSAFCTDEDLLADPEMLAAETALSFRFAKGPHDPGVALPGYEGCIRVQLMQPGHAFGHAMYAQVLTDVALRNAETLMRMAQHDADSTDQIFDRWKVPIKGGIVAFITNQWMRYQWPPQLYGMLPAQASAVIPVFPEGISAAAVVKVMGVLEKKEGFLQRAELDKALLEGLELNPKEDHAELLVAVYRWFDRLLGRVPALQPLPPPPLTPTLSAVTVSYEASATVSFEEGDVAGGQVAWCHQLLPFATPRVVSQGGAVLPLVPRLKAGGCLYVGLKNVAAPQMISLLFVLTGQRARVPEAEDAAPTWSVLCRSGWVPCSAAAHSLKDSTYGLQKSGRVQVLIPEEMDDQSTQMPAGLCWLQIHTPHPECFPTVSQILVQAGVAEQVLGPAAAQAGCQPLAAGAIKALQQPDARVKAILQPLPSHGGRAGESEPQFLARVSERLRHKGRAWTGWDYERVLLQQFPGIFYARCLPHTCAPGSDEFKEPARAPGHVLVVVVPLLPEAPGVLPPVFAAAELLEMQSWLRERASPVVKLRVCNPVYEIVQIRLHATFDGSQRLGEAQARLNRELQEHLSPWIYRPHTVQLPPFEFHLEEIRAFIQARSYVKILHDCAFGSGTQGVVAGERIRPSHAWCMLVTAAVHEFTPVSPP